MTKGRIIFLNGLTSCGKTSVAEQMKCLCSDVIYFISNDTFHDMVDWRFFEEDFWKMVAYTITAQYYAARAMVEAGFSVVIDGMLLDLPEYREQTGKSHAEFVSDIFNGIDVTYVDCHCPLEELRRRNLARGNRKEFQSDEQAALMTKNFTFDLTINVMTVFPDESAVRILEFCNLPYSFTGQINCDTAAARGNMLSSLFGSRAKVTVLTSGKYDSDGYPIEICMTPADPTDPLTDELIRRGYTEFSRTERVITLVRGSRERLRILLTPDADITHTLSQLGKTVNVTVDRPAGSTHPDFSDMVYPVNYGCVSGISSGDGEDMDAYIPGVCEPLSSFEGTVSAVLHRFDDCDDKLIVTPPGVSLSLPEIRKSVEFCEKYFDSIIIRSST